MPRGVTPKERMKRSTVTLAKNLKPSGRLNTDDIKHAGEMRKDISRTDFKKRAILKKMDTAKYSGAKSLGAAGDMIDEIVGKFKKSMSTTAGQTKSTKRPKQSIFQQLKKAQMIRKHDGRGKK
jgi:hypothetical protein